MQTVRRARAQPAIDTAVSEVARHRLRSDCDRKTTANVHRTTSPRTFAVVELTAYLRSAVAALLAVAAVFIACGGWPAHWRRRWGLFNCFSPADCWQDSHGSPMLRADGPAPWRKRADFPGDARHRRVVLAPRQQCVALLGFWAVIVGEELWAWRCMLPVRRSNAPADCRLAGSSVGNARTRAARRRLERRL